MIPIWYLITIDRLRLRIHHQTQRVWPFNWNRYNWTVRVYHTLVVIKKPNPRWGFDCSYENWWAFFQASYLVNPYWTVNTKIISETLFVWNNYTLYRDYTQNEKLNYYPSRSRSVHYDEKTRRQLCGYTRLYKFKSVRSHDTGSIINISVRKSFQCPDY
jgi:hypothetical protein